MSNTGMNLGMLERNLAPMQSRFERLVEPVGLHYGRFLETCLMTYEKNARDFEDFDVGENLRWVNTAGTLGLEPDGNLGQFWPIVFKGKNPCIQPITGYRGMITNAARAGIAIHSGLIRHGDEWQGDVGPGSPMKVRPKLGDRSREPILAAWAQAQLPDGTYSSAVIMDLSEILAIKGRSPGARKQSSPWNDMEGPGFAAMATKSGVRKLNNHLPMLLTRGLERMNISQHALNGALSVQHEEVGLRSYINDKARVVTEGGISEDPEKRSLWRVPRKDQRDLVLSGYEEWIGTIKAGLQKISTLGQIAKTKEVLEPIFADLRAAGEEIAVVAAEQAITDVERTLK